MVGKNEGINPGQLEHRKTPVGIDMMDAVFLLEADKNDRHYGR